MFRLLLTFLIICIFSVVQAWPILSLHRFTVADKVTGRGISRATLAIGQLIFITNDDGSVVIQNKLLTPGENIHVTCVGYNPLDSRITTKKLPDTLKLEPLTIPLRSISIALGRPEIKLGDMQKKFPAERITRPNAQYVQYIPNGQHLKGTITTVSFDINNRLHGIRMPFRLGLFAKKAGSALLANSLIGDGIVVRNTEGKKHINVDVSRYQVPLPADGVMVAFETLPPQYYGTDSVWYQGNKMARTPGIDMHLRNKDDFSSDEKDMNDDRKGAYSMVINTDSKADSTNYLFQTYRYATGTSFAITISVDVQQ